jgi:hypothetical protein
VFKPLHRLAHVRTQMRCVRDVCVDQLVDSVFELCVPKMLMKLLPLSGVVGEAALAGSRRMKVG